MGELYVCVLWLIVSAFVLVAMVLIKWGCSVVLLALLLLVLKSDVNQH